MSHTLEEVIEMTIKATVLKCHPVGSYFLTESSDDPNTLFGGTWTKIQGNCLWCSDSSHAAGTTIAAGLPNITGWFSVVGNNSEASWTSNVKGGGRL